MPGTLPRSTLPRIFFPWIIRLLTLSGLVAVGCSNLNRGLALPKTGGPIPVANQRTPSEAERAYWSQLAPARVIYIGETHNSNSDHEYQLEVLKGLKARGAKFVVGWEMFDATQQSLLDQWNNHHLDTEALLEQTDFQRHWGVYSVMYEKILRWTQAEGIASVALNAPGALSHKLALGQPLDAGERAMMPVGYQPLPGGYEHFVQQMGSTPHEGADMENFYKAQLLWDETMAAHIVDYLDSHPSEKIVVLLGRGHVDGGFGVPAFVSQKTDVAQLVVYPNGVPSNDNAPKGSRVVSLDQNRAGRSLWSTAWTGI